MIKAYSSQVLNEAVSFLRQGKLIAIPTETVYGLGADAANPAAVQRIFEVKKRPVDHPVIVHIASPATLANWAKIDSDDVLKLANKFWPGPLTLILPRQSWVSDWITGGQDTIGIRIPAHPIAQAILQEFGGGIAAPSANSFGRISPTRAIHVEQDLGELVSLIVDGGECGVGIESTILDLSGTDLRLLRPGAITASEISTLLNKKILQPHKESPRVSGSLEMHYSPLTPLKIISPEDLSRVVKSQLDQNRSVGVISTHLPTLISPLLDWICLSAEPDQYAHHLYAKLHELDKKTHAMIYVEALPLEEKWLAIRDRLIRAAHP